MKTHKPLWPTTPLPQYTNYWIGDDDMMAEFTLSDIERIRTTKQELVNRLQTFWMTTEKVGSSKSWFVSGGCIGSLLRGEEVNDIDVYFFSQAEAERVTRLFTQDDSYMHEVAEYNDKYRDVPNPGGKLITENAITLKSGVQIITKHYGYPEQIRATFDFAHCTPYFDSRDQKLYISKQQYDLNMNKILLVNNSSTFGIHRENKFIGKGWRYGDPQTKPV